MTKLPKALISACIIASMAISFVGCGSTKIADSSSSIVSSTQTAPASVVPAKPLTLRFSWWGSDPRHKVTMEAIDLYKTIAPNVTIESEYMGADGYKDKLMTQLASGTAPDIIQVDAPWLSDLVKQFNAFADLDQFKSILDTSGFDEKFVKTHGAIDNKQYGLPTGTNVMCMLLNKDILAKANIKSDQVWDWDTIMSEGQKVNKIDSKSYFLDMDQNAVALLIVRPYIKQKTGKQLVNDDYTIGFDKTTLVDTLTYIKKLFDAKVIQPAAESFMYKTVYFQNPTWVNNQTAATIEWVSMIVARKEGFKASAEVSLFPIPKDAKDTALLVRPAQLLCINDKSAAKEETAKFMNFFLNNKDAQLILKDQRSVPPTEAGRKVLTDANLIDPLVSQAVNMSVEKAGTAENAISSNTQLDTIMIDAVEKVAYGKSTPEVAADDMIKQFQSKLNELKALTVK